MDKCKKEKEQLYNWAKSICCGEEVFSKYGQDVETYYKPRSKECRYICEYDFQTINELEKCIDMILLDNSIPKEIKKTILIAIMKNKINVNKVEEIEGCNEETLPTYIYNF